MIDENNKDYEILMFNMNSFFIRKGNFGDMYTVRENIGGKQYRNLIFKRSDIVLDIGGHIGTFAAPIADKVERVISVEMDAENFELLEANMKPYANADIINAAVVADANEDATVRYYKAKKNSGAHSMYVVKGRGEPVESHTIKISNLLRDTRPSIIKCDIEGAEYDVLDELVFPENVKQIIVEFHFGHKGWRDKANKIIADIVSQGFESSDVSDMNKNKNWTRIVYFSRN